MIIKKAAPPYWSKVVQKVKALGLKPEIVSMLNNFNQIVWDASPPASNPNAVAYVSSEDLNNDGKIDKIHFVLSKFPPNATDEEIDGIVGHVAKTLVHEHGHIADFDSEKMEFPGGENAAESAERAAEGMIDQKLKSLSSIITTNKKKAIDSSGYSAGRKRIEMYKDLIKMANRLDQLGERDLADKLDDILKLGESESYIGEADSFADGLTWGDDESFLDASGGEYFDEYSEDEEGYVDDGGPVEYYAKDEEQIETVASSDNTKYDRINKLADLMSREFTNGASGVFRR